MAAPAIAVARPWRGVVPAAVAMLLLVGLVQLLPGQGYLLNLMMQAVTYAIAVAGIVVVLGYCGQISLAQAAFFGLGAYGAALGTADYGLPFFVALAAGVALAGVFGLILGVASLRLGGHYLAMVTISFQQILTLVLTNWNGLTHGPDGVRDIARPAGLTGGDAYLGVCLAALVLTTLYAWRLKTSRLGRAMQAVRDNEIAASTCGIDVFLTKVLAFGISAVLGGVGGGLFAGAFSYISPDQFSFAESIVLLTMALLGGVQSPFGALLGTGLLVMLPEWLRFLRQIYLAVYGGAVILIMVFLPDGLWGFAASRMRRVRSVAGDIAPLPLLAETAVASTETLLRIEGLAKHFGGLRALDGVDIAVRRGTVHALIGPNGSGKSTFINVLTGLYRPTAGRVWFGGADITGLAPHLRTRAGLARTFQNIRVFRGMTVLENVMIGAERPGNDVAGQPGPVVERALAALEFVGLRGDALRLVGQLSYGHQRYVEIARALAGSPQLVLLDEPAAGLNMTEKHALGELLRRLKGHGLTILIVDHDMNLVEQVADHITVLNFGRRIADGDPRAVLRHPDVIAAYLASRGRVPLPLLELRGVQAGYGAGPVLKGLDLHVDEGEIVALLGSNGAGKSTTLRAISGLVPGVAGSITLGGQSLLGMKPEAIVRLGCAHVPEGRRVFPGLTVRENIALGASNRRGVTRRALDGEVDAMVAYFAGLERLQHALGWTLSGGQLQMVAVARGLMAKPRLLLLDEPSLGLAPLIVQQVFRIVADIRSRGTTVLLVEQNAHMALSVADRGYVLETGRLLVTGPPADLWDNDDVRAAYLGGRTGTGVEA